MKKLHSIVSFLLALAIMATCLPMVPLRAKAASILSSGTCGENVTWVVDDECTLTISGTGPMYDYDRRSPFHVPDFFRIERIVIENGVTTIGDYAFSGVGCSTVLIADSVTSIGYCAFYNCDALNSINIGDNVLFIGEFSFGNCDQLTGIFVDDNNLNYSSMAGVLFNKDQTELIQVPSGMTGGYIIPDSVISYKAYAFDTCFNLISVTVGSGITKLENCLISNCGNLEEVILPDTITYVSNEAFQSCDNIMYSAHGGADYLGNADNPYMVLMHSNSWDITSCQIHAGTKVICSDAFSECTKLKEIHIPHGLICVGEDAFNRCDSLTDVYYDGTRAQWEAIDFFGGSKGSITVAIIHLTDGIIDPSIVATGIWGNNLTWTFSNKGVLTVSGVGPMAEEDCPQFGPGAVKKIVIQDGVTSICPLEGSSYDSVASVTVGKDVVQIPWTIRTAFFVSDENPTYSSDENGILFNKDKTVLLCVPEDMEGSYAIPATVKTIGDNAFSTCSLSSVIVYDNVIEIGKDAFADCLDLNLYLQNPDWLCGENHPVSFGPHSGNITMHFLDADGDVTTEITISDSITEIPDNAFYGCANITKVNLPAQLVFIGDGAFDNCTGLTSITIPTSVTTMGGAFGATAFYGCTALKDIYFNGTREQWNPLHKQLSLFIRNQATIHLLDGDILPGAMLAGTLGTNLTWVLDSEGTLTISGKGEMNMLPDDILQFNGPADLAMVKKLVIEEGVTSVCELVVLRDLSEVVLPNTVTTIGSMAFYDCENLTSIRLPENLTEIGYSAFENAGLTSIQLPEKLTTIGQTAFMNTKLTAITFPASVQTIDGGAFNGTKITSVVIPDTVRYVGPSAFAYCTSLTTAAVYADESELGSHLFACCTELSSVILEDGIKIMGEGCFVGCGKLTSVTIPGSVDNIDFSTFSSEFSGYTCGLKDIVILEGVAHLGPSGAFSGCPNLKTITIPKSAYIYRETFDFATSVTDIYYGGTREEWTQNSGHKNEDIAGATVHYNASAAPDGWNLLDGKWYYYKNNAKLTGWVLDGKTWYYMNSAGVMQTGWVSDGGKWYYMNTSGAMVTGWLQQGSTWYYMNSSGAMVTGWAQVGGVWYYFKSSGAMVTGWQKVGGVWYYFKSSGAMATGWQKVGSTWYYFKSSGAMQTGWLKLGNTWYYFHSSGAMATGSLKIGAKTYRFNASGACLNP